MRALQGECLQAPGKGGGGLLCTMRPVARAPPKGGCEQQRKCWCRGPRNPQRAAARHALSTAPQGAPGAPSSLGADWWAALSQNENPRGHPVDPRGANEALTNRAPGHPATAGLSQEAKNTHVQVKQGLSTWPGPATAPRMCQRCRISGQPRFAASETPLTSPPGGLTWLSLPGRARGRRLRGGCPDEARMTLPGWNGVLI